MAAFQAKSSIVVKVGLVGVAFEARRIEVFEPGLQYRRDVSGGFQLPQRDPDTGAAVAIPSHRRWRLLR